MTPHSSQRPEPPAARPALPRGFVETIRRAASAVLLCIGATAIALAHEGHRHPPRSGQSDAAQPVAASIGGAVELRDHEGRSFVLGGRSDRPTLVFFGFTRCPEACPTTLVEAAQIRAALGAARAPTVAFVTLDPDRDTPAVLKAYTGAFDASFIGLTGTAEQIAQAAERYRVGYRRVPAGSSYTIEHSAYVYLLDEAGRVVRLYRHGTEAAVMVRDLQRLGARDAARR